MQRGENDSVAVQCKGHQGNLRTFPPPRRLYSFLRRGIFILGCCEAHQASRATEDSACDAGITAPSTYRPVNMPHGRNYRDPRRINRQARNLARQRLLAQQALCAICDRPIDDTIAWPDPMSAEVDEIIPVSRGGSATDLHNLEKVHRCCNQLKSDKSLAWARRKVKGTPALKPTAMPFSTSDW